MIGLSAVCSRGSSFLVLFTLLIAPAAQSAVWYVDARSAAPAPDGKSWDRAFSAIQPAIDSAFAAGGGDIWVAGGTYGEVRTGGLSPDDVENHGALFLREGVHLYGGFRGDEIDRNSRDFRGNETIISAERSNKGEPAERVIVGANSATVDGFTITGASGGYLGGALYIAGTSPTLRNCLVEGNSSPQGPGLYCENGSPTFENVTFLKNATWNRSGFAVLYIVENSSATFVNSIVVTRVNDGRITLALEDSSASFVHCTVSAERGSFLGANNSHLSFLNSIVWGPKTISISLDSGATTLRNCITQDPDFVGSDGNRNLDPKLIAPLRGDARIRFDSPCVDAGDAEAAIFQDVRGLPRPAGTSVDIGAYEFTPSVDPGALAGPVYVDGDNTSGIEDGLSWDTAFTEILPAITRAYGGAAADVWIAAGEYDEIRDPRPRFGDSGALLIPAGMRIYGGFRGDEVALAQRDWATYETVVSGRNARRGRPAVHVVECGAGVTLDGLTISDGAAYYPEFNLSNSNRLSLIHASAHGGGIVVREPDVTVRNCRLSDNIANLGGGFFADAENFVLDNCTLDGNAAAEGGGGYFTNGTIKSSLFTRNSADRFGGGLYSGFLRQSGEHEPESAIEDCRFLENTANISGGGINVSVRNLSMSHTSLLNNRAATGGGIYCIDAALMVDNSLIARNTSEVGGGIVASYADLFLNSSTVADNDAASGLEITNYTAAEVNSATIWGNTGNDIAVAETSEVEIAFSNIGTGYASNEPGNLSVNPLFIDPQNADYRLSTESPLIDMGDPGFRSGQDLRGVPRPVGPRSDIGTYEYFAGLDEADSAGGGEGEGEGEGEGDKHVWYVDNRTPRPVVDGLTWETAFYTLQDAIDVAYESGGGDVWVSAGRYDELRTGPVTALPDSASGALVMRRKVHLYGGFAGGESRLEERDWVQNVSTIDGSRSLGGNPAHQVLLGASESTLDGFTITKSVSENYDYSATIPGQALSTIGTSPTIRNCHFTNISNATNSFYGAETVYNLLGSPAFVNCLFDNTSRTDPIVNNDDGDISFLHCTLVANDSGTSIVNGGLVRVVNSIVWNFGAESVFAYDPGLIVEYSNVKDYWLAGSDGNISQDPGFIDAVSGDFRIRPGSPCVDSGATIPNPPETDLRLATRLRGNAPDMGAFEYASDRDPVPLSGPVFVNQKNNAGVENGLSWQTAFTTLQPAVDLAYTRGGGEIWVAQGDYGETRNALLLGDAESSGAVLLRDGVYCFGGFEGHETRFEERDWVANPTIINGAHARDGVAAYHVVVGADNCTLDGFIVLGGEAKSTLSAFTGSGGGVYVPGVDTYIANCIIKWNTASAGGGGVFVNGGSPTFRNCIVEGNSSRSGAGICVGRNWDDHTSEDEFPDLATVISCTIRNNYAESNGGGICVSSAAVVARSTMLDANRSSQEGGALSATDGKIQMVNCVVANNSAAGTAAAAALVRSELEIRNGTITGNSSPDGAAIVVTQNSSSAALNSILWGNSPTDLQLDNVSEATESYSFLGDGFLSNGERNLSGNPGLVNAAGGDFSLLASSPCIDAGTELDAPVTDLRGYLRPTGDGIDMGAYEYGATALPTGTGAVALAELSATLLNYFDEADADSDETISSAELTILFESVTPAQFAALDRNHDGFLTREELRVEDPNPDVSSGCRLEALEAIGKTLGDIFLLGLSLIVLPVVGRLAAH